MVKVWRVGVITGDLFEIKSGDMWDVVVKGSGISDLKAGCEDEKGAAVWAEEARAAAARNGLRVDDFVVS